MSTEIVYIVTQIHIISYIFFVYYFLILLANFHFERVVVSNVKKKWEVKVGVSSRNTQKSVCVCPCVRLCVCVSAGEHLSGKANLFYSFSSHGLIRPLWLTSDCKRKRTQTHPKSSIKHFLTLLTCKVWIPISITLFHSVQESDYKEWLLHSMNERLHCVIVPTLPHQCSRAHTSAQRRTYTHLLIRHTWFYMLRRLCFS